MTTDPFADLGPVLERDRYGRPMVTPPDGGKKIAYTRCTTFVSALEDTFNLSKWQQRQVAIGLSMRPDLVGLAAGARHDKKALSDICEQAHQAAASSAAANTGTAIHAATEVVDRGGNMSEVAEQYRDDVAAYLTATAGMSHPHIEQFMVLDSLKIGGTPDRVTVLPDGRKVILDLKTGSVDWGMGKIAQQLAVYSRSLVYDIETGMRHPLEVDQNIGIVAHLPAGSGQCRLIEVDIAAGWEAVQLSAQVRAWRARKNLARDYTNPVAGMAPVDDLAPLPTKEDLRLAKQTEILALIHDAPDLANLNGVYARYIAHWSNELTAAAAERKAALVGGAA